MDKKGKVEKAAFPASTDIYKDEEAVVLTMEMPGVSKENLDIRVDKDLLIIDGKRDNGPEEGEYRIREIRPGNFHQEYTIDDTIDRNKIEASITGGLVTLVLGLKESEKPRKITVSSQ
jgi:HSP20 family protein